MVFLQMPAEIARPIRVVRAKFAGELLHAQMNVFVDAQRINVSEGLGTIPTSVRLFFIVHPLVTHHVVTPRRLIFAEFAIPNDVVSGFAVDHDVVIIVVIVGVVHRDVVVGWCC